MQKYLIEREIPGAGQLSQEELRAIGLKSSGILDDLGPEIEWEHSYVVGDKIFCVFNTSSEALIREHGECGGFPVTTIYAVHAMMDPPKGA